MNCAADMASTWVEVKARACVEVNAVRSAVVIPDIAVLLIEGIYVAVASEAKLVDDSALT